MLKDIEVRFTERENSEINKKIINFVSNMGEKGEGPSINYYQNNRKATRAAQNIFLGKKAEFIALRSLQRIRGGSDFDKLEVDMEIRYRKEKGWKPDFQVSETNYHVKACSFSTKDFCGDYSWTFQFSNEGIPAGKDDLFNSKGNDFIILIYMKEAMDAIGIVKGILPWLEIKPLLRDPLKKSLFGLKKCLYFKDLTKSLPYGES